MTAVKPLEEKTTDLDNILAKFSIYKRYHLQIAALIFLAFVSNSAYCSNFIFVAEEVNYTCVRYSSYGNLSSDCTEWVYENPHSFVAEIWPKIYLHCNRDTRGVLGLARSFSPWYWLYIALEFLEAAVGDSCSPAYILITEVVSSKQRIKFILLCGIGYTFGGILIALAAWSVPYWRTFLRLIYTPALLFIFYEFLLDESPRWLLIKGQNEKAVKILEKAARTNKQKLDKGLLEKLSCQKEEGADFVKIIRSTFGSGLLRKRFLVCLVWWTTSTFVNYGLTINSVSLQGNKYINFGLLSVVDIPGLFIISYILIYCKRKLPLVCCFFAAAVLCISQPFVPLNLPWLSVVLFMAGKVMSSFYFNITYLYTSELFPTYTRNSMHALCSSLGRIGSIISPQTPLLMQFWFGLPSFVFGLTSLFAGLVTFMVPDISNDSLPDTVREAEEIGKSNNSVETVDINCKISNVTRF